ncbi:flagellar motor protein MotS [Alkalibacillus aidingensis]|uniref:flagellar motor protein MotS n=1 Tax=Alkalibacillus aidingensis TaxID=2747607 RepID=UPI0016602D6D|nr:flagellar motor protein MotS [Alkalibacillus aidingensis]
MKRKKRTQPKRSAPVWMVTYSDMVTLILVFFILLFSMSQIDAVKFNAVAESYRDNVIFDFLPSAVPLENPTDHEDQEDNGGLLDEEDYADLSDEELAEEIAEDQENLEELHDEIQDYLDEHELNDVVSATRTERGIVLVLEERVLFESGRASLIDDFLPFLDKVAVLLDNIPNDINVEGHTDDVPMNSYRYPSNWELSTARASSVLRYFVEEQGLDPTRFKATGYGEYRPVAENDSAENRQKNRRVEIIILELNYERR